MYSVANLKYSPFGLILCVMALVAMAALPMPALAKVYLAGPGGSTGDPVDSNDLDPDGTAGGGGSGDDINDSLSVSPPVTEPLLPVFFEFLRVIIVPAGTGPLSIQLLFIVDSDPAAAEGAHAR